VVAVAHGSPIADGLAEFPVVASSVGAA
jgi:hypothetical protein